jgi:hypothetical protein
MPPTRCSDGPGALSAAAERMRRSRERRRAGSFCYLVELRALDYRSRRAASDAPAIVRMRDLDRRELQGYAPTIGQGMPLGTGV